MKTFSQFLKQLLFISSLLIMVACNNSEQHADTILIRTSIWTGNAAKPFATAMAVQGETIMAVGSDEEILKLKGEETNIIDLNGKFVCPGFIDTHLHFFKLKYCRPGSEVKKYMTVGKTDLLCIKKPIYFCRPSR